MLNKIYFCTFNYLKNADINILPISTVAWKPKWFSRNSDKIFIYKMKNGKSYYSNVEYRPLTPRDIEPTCIDCDKTNQGNCKFLNDYKNKIDKIDFDHMIKRFEYGLNKYNCDAIWLLFYEDKDNPCSERIILKDYFTNHGIEVIDLN